MKRLYIIDQFQKSFVTKGDDCKRIKIKKDRITLLLC